ncbi:MULTISPECIES: hypothetical protein [unclassified Duganella]|uniref:hypothetical protein n=1 Tax=unclassified Duganella TaxID=2636909 RepID=UPI000B8416D0|nr:MULTISPECIES: hypothetical protein [unclassified Duganella]
MNSKRIYYSCSTRLSYEICQLYYGQLHYAWCAPFFDAESSFSPHNCVPPSSNPRAIYWSLKKEIDAGDWHSRKIKGLRKGMLNGAALKLNAGIINRSQHQEIVRTIKRSQLIAFSPLMFVIPVEPLAGRFVFASMQLRANPMSEEYIITDLPRDLFDAFEL